MNQILATKPVKQSKSVNIKTVVAFFAVSILIFGICLVSSGSYAMYVSLSSKEKTNNNIPSNTSDDNYVSTPSMQINLSVDGAKIKASIVGESKISFVTYKWDDEDESTEKIDDVTGEVYIDIPEGQHTLTVTAVDVNNNTETEVKEVRGIVNDSKPKLEVTQDGSEFVIDSSDEVGLDRFEFILNGQGYLVRVEGEKEKQFRYPLQPGDNTLEVTAYNVEGKTATFNAICHNN